MKKLIPIIIIFAIVAAVFVFKDNGNQNVTVINDQGGEVVEGLSENTEWNEPLFPNAPEAGTDDTENESKKVKAKKNIKVKGRVIDRFGSGVSNAVVSWKILKSNIKDIERGTLSQHVTTDKEGNFQFTEQFFTSAGKEETLYLYVINHNKSQFSKLHEFPLKDGENEIEVTIQLLPVTTVKFSVTSAEGKVKGAGIHMKGEKVISISVHTDKDGLAKVSVPCEVQFKLYCIGKGYKPWVAEEMFHEGTDKFIEIFLNNGSLQLVGKCLTESGIPIKGVKVIVIPLATNSPRADVDGTLTALSDDSGRFVVNDVPTEKVNVKFEHKDYISPKKNGVNVQDELIVTFKQALKIKVTVNLPAELQNKRYGRDYVFEWNVGGAAVPIHWSWRFRSNTITATVAKHVGQNHFICKASLKPRDPMKLYYREVVTVSEETSEITINLAGQNFDQENKQAPRSNKEPRNKGEGGGRNKGGR